MIQITPSMTVANVANDTEGRALYYEPSQAVEAVNAGLDIVVPSFTVARQVLLLLGLTEDEVADRIHFARTGEVRA